MTLQMLMIAVFMRQFGVCKHLKAKLNLCKIRSASNRNRTMPSIITNQIESKLCKNNRRSLNISRQYDAAQHHEKSMAWIHRNAQLKDAFQPIIIVINFNSFCVLFQFIPFNGQYLYVSMLSHELLLLLLLYLSLLI